MDLERSNAEQIDRLNQRGGRTLSIVDLIHAGTISMEISAYAMRAMDCGASLLTGARPGGAGKTTLMAAILQFLPRGVPIVTIDSPGVLAEALAGPADRPACYLVHEIGAGHWYGYLWGRDVERFISLASGNRRIASCLHADTLGELTTILTSPPLEVPREALGRVGLVLFMHVGRGLRGARRRVAALHEADGQGGHDLRFEWDAQVDTFRRAGEVADPDDLAPYVDFVQRIAQEGDTETRDVRRKVIEFYTRKDTPVGRK